jgi:large subunit ribosomal protein L29
MAEKKAKAKSKAAPPKVTRTKVEKKASAAAKTELAKPQVSKAKVASAADEFRAKSADELSAELGKLKREQFNLRFQRANGQLERTSRVRIVRRDIARIQTIMNEQRRKAAQAQG